MKKKPLKKKHLEKLSDYGLQGILLDSCMCFQPGEMVLREGMPITWLALIVSGKAKVCAASPNGKNLVLCYYVSDGVIGDIEFMAGLETATANLIAVTDFECIAIPCREHAKDLRTNVTFLNKLGNELSRKLVRSSNNFVSAALYSGEERLCSYILQTSHNNIFNDVLTEVSGSIGMSYRHIFRLLSSLCEEGVLEKRESGYHILKREDLMRRAAALYPF